MKNFFINYDNDNIINNKNLKILNIYQNYILLYVLLQYQQFIKYSFNIYMRYQNK